MNKSTDKVGERSAVPDRTPDQTFDETRPSDAWAQTPQQRALTGRDGGGRSDESRKADWPTAGGAPGRPPAALGGSSQGQSDRKPAGGASESNAEASSPVQTTEERGHS